MFSKIKNDTYFLFSTMRRKNDVNEILFLIISPHARL